jgi:hypothetical protein
MSLPEETWAARLHAAVDDHPGALDFDVPSYLAAGRRRARRNRAVALAATVGAVAVVVAVGVLGPRAGTPEPAPELPLPTPATSPNGWVALDVSQDEDPTSAIYLVRPGHVAHRLQIDGPENAEDGCPAWSPDGTRLMFGRLLAHSNAASQQPELVVVPVDRNGAAGSPTTIALDGFQAGDSFGRDYPCATWASDGRWSAFAGADDVWLADTRTGQTRRLPLQATDLEWRPGTDQLTIAGQIRSRDDATVSSPVTIYTVSTGKSHHLGSIQAANITWSPDGTTLAYMPGEEGPQDLRLVDADGTHPRLLASGLSPAGFGGAGPMWSPAGDLIAYQASIYWPSQSVVEFAKVALISVADGSTKFIKPPKPPDPEPMGRHSPWWPRWSTWSPDGTTLLYSAWCHIRSGPGGDGHATLTVPVDAPENAAVLTNLTGNSGEKSRVAVQVWGSQ